jgi:hypothetical protein
MIRAGKKSTLGGEFMRLSVSGAARGVKAPSLLARIVAVCLWLLGSTAFAGFPSTATFTSSYGMTGPTAVAACTAAGVWLSGRGVTYNYEFVSLANVQSGYADCVYDIYYKSGALYYANDLVGNARLLNLPTCPMNSTLSVYYI